LDNVSISGATGVLVNITGGADLTLGEVHQINEIIHDAVGDDAEIIFGAVHEPAMQGEIRVTVIATGFDKALSTGNAAVHEAQVARPNVIPLHSQRVVQRASGTATRASQVQPHDAPVRRSSAPPVDRAAATDDDMEIPTFIRRQMD
jgi:cell division protein FtsZ